MDHDAEKHYELQPLSQRRGSGTALHCNFRNYTLYLDSTTNLLLYLSFGIAIWGRRCREIEYVTWYDCWWE